MNRMEANITICNILREAVLDNPDMRFGQIMCRIGIVKDIFNVTEYNSQWENEFYLESEDLLTRVQKRK